jgi:selenide,water dikinase
MSTWYFGICADSYHEIKVPRHMERSPAATRITKLASCGGCAAKVGPADLRRLVAGLPAAADPRLLVGIETGDDAAVFALGPELALVSTTDFITPVCDDPYLYGQVAAANAISDVFAMGGTPVLAIAVCGFPDALTPEQARAILAGGADKATEAGAVVAGGHTIRNDQLFYGLAVTGRVHPSQVVRNVGARPGDALVLTKPLGSGLVVNGARDGKLPEADLLATCRAMAALNAAASALMVQHHAHAATDVTGFGLAGHALGMARGSRVSLRVWAERLPVYARALDMHREGVKTRGTVTNRAAYETSVRVAPGVSDERAALVYDPQTSGGLLVALPPDAAAALVSGLHARGVGAATVIGEVTEARGESVLALEV